MMNTIYVGDGTRTLSTHNWSAAPDWHIPGLFAIQLYLQSKSWI